MNPEQFKEFTVSFNLVSGNCMIDGYTGSYSNYYDSILGLNLPQEPEPTNPNSVSYQSNTLRIPGQIKYQGKWYNVVNTGRSLQTNDGKYSFTPNINSDAIKVLEFDKNIQPVMCDFNSDNNVSQLYLLNRVNNSNKFNQLKRIVNLPLSIAKILIDCPNLEEVTYNQNKPTFGSFYSSNENVLITAPEFYLTDNCLNYDIPDFVQKLPNNFLYLTLPSQKTYTVHIPKDLEIITNNSFEFSPEKTDISKISKINFIVDASKEQILRNGLNNNERWIDKQNTQITINGQPFTFAQTNTPKL